MTDGTQEPAPAPTGLLVHGPVLAASHRRGRAAPAMAVSGGRVVALGDLGRCRRALSDLNGRGVHELRPPPGGVVVPGFVDPHVHLRAMAGARCSVDLSSAPGRDALLARLTTAPGVGWVRAVGWDDALGHGPLTRADLDAACPGRPVVVHHATGHAVALNTAALRHLGADHDDHHDGILAGHHPALAQVPRLDPAELRAALHGVGAELAAAGVVAVEDASATNDIADVAALTSSGLPARVQAMVGAAAAGDAPVGTRIKLVVDDATTSPELADAIAAAHRRDQPVALHVVDIGPLQTALDALAAAPPPPPGRPDRLEHVSLCLPEQVDAIAGAGAVVVTQPAFLAHRGDKYRAALTPVEHAWLYRVGSLLAAGVPVAASSDAPVVPARPLESVQAMVQRDPAEAVDVATALDLVTRRAAAASGADGSGVLLPGHRADFVVLGADPGAVAPTELAAIPVLSTWVRGRPAGEGTVAPSGAGAGTVAVGRCCG